MLIKLVIYYIVLILHIYCDVTSCTTIYASPNGTQSNSCTEYDPCSLSQASLVISSNGIIILQDGEYLVEDMIIITAQNVTIQAENYQAATVVGDNIPTLFNITNDITFMNFSITGSTNSNYSISSNSISLYNMKLYSMYTSGYLIFCNDLIMDNCEFQNVTCVGNSCIEGYRFQVSNCKFQSINILSNERGFISSLENATYQNSQFLDITVIAQVNMIQGAAIYSNTTQISGCLFSNCTIISSTPEFDYNFHGGAIALIADSTIDNTTFNNCSLKLPTQYLAYGGAIYTTQATITVDNCYFENCFTSTGNSVSYGGAIFALGTLNINNSMFSNCSANSVSKNSSIGGAIYAVNCNIDYSSFIDCSTKSLGIASGAAIISTNLTLSNSLFDGCTSTGGTCNGTVCAEIVSQIFNCTFTECSCISDTNGKGAAIAISSSINNISNCSFESCFVLSSSDFAYGGAVYLNTNTNITDCFFNSNFVSVITNSTFASAKGGAIYIEVANQSVTDSFILQSIFINCSAQSEFAYSMGGAITFSSSGHIDSCYFDSCYISTIGNSAYGGSVAFISEPSSISLSNSIFRNSRLNAMSSTSSPSTNSAGLSSYGGAVYSIVSNSWLFSNLIFQSCSSYGDSDSFDTKGGAVALMQNNINSTISPIIQNSTFFNCTSSQYGGAIFGTWISVVNISVTNCSAQYGSAVHSNDTLSIESSIFTHNVAEIAGGAIYSSVLLLSNVVLTQNSISPGQPEAQCNGGAVYVDGSSEMSNITFTDNNIAIECLSANGGALFLSANVHQFDYELLSFNSNHIDCSNPEVSFGAAIFSSNIYNFSMIEQNNNTLSCWNSHPALQSVFIPIFNLRVYVTPIPQPNASCTYSDPCDIQTALALNYSYYEIIFIPGIYNLTAPMIINSNNIMFSGSNSVIYAPINDILLNVTSSVVQIVDIEFRSILSTSLLSPLIIFDSKSNGSKLESCQFQSIVSNQPILSSQSSILISNLTVAECVLICNNHQDICTGLIDISGAVSGSAFSRNTVMYSFNSNSTSSLNECRGGVLYLNSPNNTISDCTFDSNSLVDCSSAFGAAIYIHDVDVEITGCNFFNNSIQFIQNEIIEGSENSRVSPPSRVVAGSALYINTTTNFPAVIDNSTFEQNHVVIEDDIYQIEWQEALFQGGAVAILIKEYTTTTVQSIPFPSSSSSSSSSASIQNNQIILIKSTRMDYNNLVIKPNTVKAQVNVYGGALSIVQSTDYTGVQGSILIESSNFTGNFLQASSTSGSVSIIGRNAGSAKGGAVYLDLIQLEIMFSDCIFDSNVAAGGNTLSPKQDGKGGDALGGALWISPSQLNNVITSSKFINNTCISGNGTISIESEIPQYGNAEGGAVWTANATFNNINSQNNTIQCGIWGSCYGGSLYSLTANLDGFISSFDSGLGNNMYGGVIYSNSLFIINSQISFPSLMNTNFGNTNEVGVVQGGEVQGGAIYASDNIVIVDTIINSSFVQDNICEGSAIYTAALTATNCSITNNMCKALKIAKGVIYINDYASISSSTISNNIGNNQTDALSIGGALYSKYSNVSISDTLFNTNIALFGGAIAIEKYQNNTQLVITNTTFINNVAKKFGSVIFISDWDENAVPFNCSSSLNDNNAYNNSAQDGRECGSVISQLSAYPSPLLTEIYSGLEFNVSLSLLNWFQEPTISTDYYVTAAISGSEGVLVIPQNDVAFDDSQGIFTFNNIQIFSDMDSVSLLFSATSITTSNILPTYNLTATFIVASCGPNTYEVNSTFSSCFPCSQNSYNFNSASQCVSCPSYFINNTATTDLCIENVSEYSFSISQGFWPDSFINPKSIVTCPLFGSCVIINCTTSALIEYSDGITVNGSLTPNNTSPGLWSINCNYCDGVQLDVLNSTTCSSLCNVGYEDRACSRCVCNTWKDCYYRSGNQCDKCISKSLDEIITPLNIALVAIIGVALVIMVIIMLILPKTMFFFILVGIIFSVALGITGFTNWYYASFVFIIFILWVIADRRFPVGVLKNLIFFLQILSSVIDINSWPLPLQPIVKTFAMSNLDISFFACLVPKVYSHPLFLYLTFNLLIPFLIALIMIVIFIELVVSTLQRVIALRYRLDKLFRFCKRMFMKCRCDCNCNCDCSRFTKWKKKKKNSDDPLSFLSPSSSAEQDSLDHDDSFAESGSLSSSNQIVKDESASESESEYFGINNINHQINKLKNNDSGIFSSVESDTSEIDLLNSSNLSPPSRSNRVFLTIKRRGISKLYRLIITLFGCFYYPITMMTLSVMPCNDGYMSEYQWISCSSPIYYIFLIIAAVVIVVFIGGYPFVLSITMIKIRRRIFDESTTVRSRLASLLGGYKLEAYSYELVYIVEKVLIAFSITLITMNSVIQFSLISTILVCAAAMQYFYRPHSLHSLNVVAFCSQIVLILSYFSNIFFITLNANASPSERIYLDIVFYTMPLLNAGIILSFLYLLVKPKLQEIFNKRRRRRSEASNSSIENFQL